MLCSGASKFVEIIVIVTITFYHIETTTGVRQFHVAKVKIHYRKLRLVMNT